MLVIDALMILYAKEVATGDRIAGTIARLSGGTIQRDKFNYETGLLCWISHACAALKRRIDLDIEQNTESEVKMTFYYICIENTIYILNIIVCA